MHQIVKDCKGKHEWREVKMTATGVPEKIWMQCKNCNKIEERKMIDILIYCIIKWENINIKNKPMKLYTKYHQNK